jgi:hypothetical protein
VDIKEPEQLQRVAKQFISAINVDNNKNVTIDSSKLNPEVLKIRGGVGVVQKNVAERGFRPFDKRTVIQKTSKYFEQKKYLITIIKIERTIDNQENKYDQNNVYLCLDLFFEIKAKCLCNKRGFKNQAWSCNLTLKQA